MQSYASILAHAHRNCYTTFPAIHPPTASNTSAIQPPSPTSTAHRTTQAALPVIVTNPAQTHRANLAYTLHIRSALPPAPHPSVQTTPPTRRTFVHLTPLPNPPPLRAITIQNDPPAAVQHTTPAQTPVAADLIRPGTGGGNYSGLSFRDMDNSPAAQSRMPGKRA